MTGWLVVFDGLDGAGKSTQLRALAERLAEAGVATTSTREPTDGPFGRKIRESAKSARMSPDDELAAFVSDRRQHVEEVIAPAVAAGHVVLVDRYYFSTVAYQGARGIDTDSVFAANAFAPEPDLLFLFDIDPRLGMARVARRGSADLFEVEAEQRRVRDIFRAIDLPPLGARQRLYRIDGGRDRDEIAADIWRVASALLEIHSDAG